MIKLDEFVILEVFPWFIPLKFELKKKYLLSVHAWKKNKKIKKLNSGLEQLLTPVIPEKLYYLK